MSWVDQLQKLRSHTNSKLSYPLLCLHSHHVIGDKTPPDDGIRVNAQALMRALENFVQKCILCRILSVVSALQEEACGTFQR